MLTLGSQETSRPPGENGPSSGKASPKQEGGGIDHFSSLRGIWCRSRRPCEFCQSERAWARVRHQRDGIALESWLCLSCAGCRMRPEA